MASDWERVDVGAPDPESLTVARTVAERYDPLVSRTTFDDDLNPETLYITVDAGLNEDAGRFDVRWTVKGWYSYHYTESDSFNCRYDRHPHPWLPTKHFHRPPEAGDDEAVPSCIEVEDVSLVTLAVLQLWRDAVDSGDVAKLQQPNPP